MTYLPRYGFPNPPTEFTVHLCTILWSYHDHFETGKVKANTIAQGNSSGKVGSMRDQKVMDIKLARGVARVYQATHLERGF